MQETQEMQVQSLGQQDLLENFIIIAWENPWTEKPGKLQFIGHKELDTAEHHHHHW